MFLVRCTLGGEGGGGVCVFSFLFFLYTFENELYYS